MHNLTKETADPKDKSGRRHVLSRGLLLLPRLLSDLVEDTNCSVLMARKGDNILRYVDFQGDPVITITGPDAEDLRQSLKKRL